MVDAPEIQNDDTKKREELYVETRAELLARQLSNSERFDNAILSLSTGALGISIVFIKDIVPIKTAQNILLLKISWWLFGLSIISTVVSFVASQAGIRTQLKFAEHYYLLKQEEYLKKKNFSSLINDFLNYMSGAIFIVAVILTIIFVSSNIGGNVQMSDKIKMHRIQGGAEIPKMQSVTSKDGASIPKMQPITLPTTSQSPATSKPAESGTKK